MSDESATTPYPISDESATTPYPGVVMDIAAFKVSHSAGTDRDATAITSGVVMDVAAFKVSYSDDIEAAAISRCLVLVHV
jgi:hypothetical protein